MFESQEKNNVFPDDRLEYDWVPFRPIVSNLDQVLDNFSLILYSCDNSNQPLLTIGNCYRVPRGVKCTISLYGDISSALLPGHIGRYIKRCLELMNKECIGDSVKCTVLIMHRDMTNYEYISKTLNQCAFLPHKFFIHSMHCMEENLLVSKYWYVYPTPTACTAKLEN